jgi:acetylornithine deacetylase
MSWILDPEILVTAARTTINQEFEQLVDASVERYTAFLQDLLRIPTPRMQEQQCVRFVGEALERAGVPVVYFEGLGLGEPTPAGRPLNLHSLRKGLGNGRSLLLQAHVDTVPTGDERRWSHGPWSAAIQDGRIYARGAHDDRTGVALLWMIADLLNQMGAATEGDLVLLVTSEEEYSCGGMQAYAQKPDRARPDAHLALDGNRTNYCILGHAGVVSFQIRLPGPWGSIFQRDLEHEGNPIEHAALLVQQLREFEMRVRDHARSLNPHPRWPDPKFLVTQIGCGSWFSNVPEECVIGGIGNAIPPMSIADLKSMLPEFLSHVSRSIPWFEKYPPELTWGPLEMPGYALEESAEFFQKLSESHRHYFRAPLQPRYIGGWGDMRLLDCPNLIFYGPGGGGGDHGYDEYYELAELAPMLKTIGRLVMDWCGVRK